GLHGPADRYDAPHSKATANGYRCEPVREGGHEPCVLVRHFLVAFTDEIGGRAARCPELRARAVPGIGQGDLHVASERPGSQPAGRRPRETETARRRYHAQLEHGTEAPGNARRTVSKLACANGAGFGHELFTFFIPVEFA